MFFHRIRLFTLCGFQVWVDASWVLLAMLVAWTLAVGVFPQAAPNLKPGTYWAMGIVATIGLLLSIVFHETAHAVVARQFGIKIRGITLFIFGGVADLELEPKRAVSELLMAAAGPVSSLFLSVVLYFVFRGIEAMFGPPAIASVFWYLGAINGALALFNLLPAFPLDGGRMFRAALWWWKRDIQWATRIAANFGNGFGILLIVWGCFTVLRGDLVSGIWQFLIGVFLRGAASASYRQTIAQQIFETVPISDVMSRSPISVPPEISLSRFIEDYVYRFHHREFPVTRDGTFIGTVGTREVTAIERAAWAGTSVADTLIPASAANTIALGGSVLQALTQIRQSNANHLYVLDARRLVGVLSRRDIMDLLALRVELTEEGRHALQS